MPVSPLAQALYEAHRQKATGTLHLAAAGTDAALLLSEGDLVGARTSFGHQSALQALLAVGKLDLSSADALWASGEAGRLDPASLGPDAPSAAGLSELQALATVRSLSRRSEQARFDGGPVEPAFAAVAGNRVVRAAFEAEPDATEWWVRCPDPSACERWALSEDERALLETLAGPRHIEPRSFAEAGLLTLLAFEGKLEAVPPQATDHLATASWGEQADSQGPGQPEASAQDPELGWLSGASGEETRSEVNEAQGRAGSGAAEGDWSAEGGLAEPLIQLSVSEVTETGSGTGSLEEPRGGSASDGELDASLEEALEVVVMAPEVSRQPGDNHRDSSETFGAASNEAQESNWPLDEDDLAGDPSDPAEASKLRRQRMMRRAMENLGALRRPGAPVEPVPEAPAAPAPAASDPVPSAAASAPATSDDAQLAHLIESRYVEFKAGLDHFGALGIPRASGREQVKAAFLSLAKVFHPDRLPAALGHLAPKMTFIFEGVRAAYDALLDDAKRRAYLVSLERSEPPAPPDPSLDHEELYKRGEMLFKKRDLLGAEEHFAKAHAAQPKSAVYLAARAWAIYMDPHRKDEAARAKQMMSDALKADPQCDRAHYQLGVIARVEGEMDKAERHFREAVRANPKHLEAKQEIRLVEMRRRNPKKGFGR